MRGRFIAGVGLSLALAAGTAAGGDPPSLPAPGLPVAKPDAPAKEDTSTLIQRVALLLPSSPLPSDPAVEKILAFERAEREKAQRKPGSFTLRLPGIGSKPTTPAPPKPKHAPAPTKTKDPPPGETVSPAQLQAVTDALFTDALTERLHKLKIAVVPEGEVSAALKSLRLTPQQASRPEGAEKLRAELNADALLTFSPARIRLMERQARTLALWMTIRVPALRTPRPDFPPLPAHPGTLETKEPITPPTEFAVSGSASAGHAFLKSTFSRTPPSLAGSAAEEAAAVALHALRAGRAPAFPQEGAQVAIAPVPAPTRADQLLFAPEGRKALMGAVQDLPADVSERFRPDLMPLFPEAVREIGVTRQALQSLRLKPEALWDKEQAPVRERVQTLGRRLGVGYVLLARITDIQVESGTSAKRAAQAAAAPPEPAPQHEATAMPGQRSRPAPLAGLRLAPAPIPPWERQGSAEAVGALVRIRDGVVLWQERATATVNSRHIASGKAEIQAADRQIAEDATRFALLQLQRRFLAYRREAAR